MQDTIGPYQVLAPLSEGGTGELYLVHRQGSSTFGVLKRLRLALACHQKASKRLIREAQITAQLNHPNIGQITDAGFDQDSFYIVMELIQGQDLQAILDAGGGVSPSVAISLVCKALEALHYAHEFKDAEGHPLDIIHRDLSPKNVMITYDGVLKLIDFGIAKDSKTEALTASGVLLGTPRYMSPEQARSETVDRRTDIYTLSVVLYELLTGQPVITGASTLDALNQIVEQQLAPIDTVVPGLSSDFANVLAQGLEKDRAARWPTALAYRQALMNAFPVEQNIESELKNLMSSLFQSQIAQLKADLQKYEAQAMAGPPSGEELVLTMAQGVQWPTPSTEVTAMDKTLASEEHTPTVNQASWEEPTFIRQDASADEGHLPTVAQTVYGPSTQLVPPPAAPHRTPASQKILLALVVGMFGLLVGVYAWIQMRPSSTIDAAVVSTHTPPSPEPRLTPRPTPRPLPARATTSVDDAPSAPVLPNEPARLSKRPAHKKRPEPTPRPKSAEPSSTGPMTTKQFSQYYKQLQEQLDQAPVSDARNKAKRALNRFSLKIDWKSYEKAKEAVEQAMGDNSAL